ncbi:hypothetical protein Trydic_g1773 [Trypoxylus dichotomus]
MGIAGSESSSGRGSRTDARDGGEIPESFDQDKDQNMDRWITKIDQSGTMHGWSKYERAYYMQAKLRGAARAWVLVGTGGLRQGVIVTADGGSQGAKPYTEGPVPATTTQAIGGVGLEAERRQCCNCQEYGTHLSRDCPKPQMERYMRCRRGGHLAAACPLRRRRGMDPQVRLINDLHKAFKKLTWAESGQKIKAHLDTGSQRNLITAACADALALELQPSDVILRRPGGARTVAIDEATMSVTIDG